MTASDVIFTVDFTVLHQRRPEDLHYHFYFFGF
jgi:hypothetical protein